RPRRGSSSATSRSSRAMRGARCAISCDSRSSSSAKKRAPPRPPPAALPRKKHLEFERRPSRIARAVRMSERRKHLEFLRKTAREAIWAGDYERALTLYDDGLSLARSWKDRDLEDLFTCNRATTLIEMDRQDFDLSRLKEILLRNPSSYNGALASYVAANAHESRGEYGRAVFYAQTALTKSRELGNEELTGTSLNLLANLELHESRFEAARELFQETVERLESRGESLSRQAAVATDTLGYCHIALDRVDLGLPLVHRSLSVLDSLGARQAMDYPALDLCFAHVKLARLDEAENWGIRAL